MKIIITGGGTGGHIYPAITIADTLRQLFPDAVILFVGAEGRMEMEKVPAAGYSIIGLPVAGLQRRLTWKNCLLPLKLIRSICKARQIIHDFKPDVVVGVGGYASAPVLWAAQRKKIPTLLQEQNSYAGITNRLLSGKTKRICVAYEGMERFFPKEKILLTGNPVRPAGDLRQPAIRDEAMAFFGLLPDKHTVLVVGGSLGARTFNRAMIEALPKLAQQNIQWIWQTGKSYFEQVKTALLQHTPENMNTGGSHLKVFEFIDRMDYAYAAADVIISRAGASTVSELCVAGKACIFVPSPNVAEDHQTKNAQALVEKNAAMMVRDDEAKEKLLPVVLELLQDETRRKELGQNIAAFAKPDAANEIVNEIVKLVAIKKQ